MRAYCEISGDKEGNKEGRDECPVCQLWLSERRLDLDRQVLEGLQVTAYALSIGLKKNIKVKNFSFWYTLSRRKHILFS